MRCEKRLPVTSRVALGTVQFGLPYGIANQGGQIPLSKAALILQLARRRGIDTLDTAAAYGDSEAVLGKIGIPDWRVVSKLPPDQGDEDPSRWVEGAVRTSLRRLNLGKLHGLLLHRTDQLLAPGGDALYKALTGVREKGLVEKIGYSIYGPGELDALFHRFPPDLVQGPFNVLDRRLATSGWFDRLSQARVEVHVRSVFLQGLLLLQPAKRPAYFEKWNMLFEAWERWLAESGLNALQASLAFVSAQRGIDRIVVGVDSASQLEQIIDSVDCRAGEPPPATLNSTDPRLINPSRWEIAS